jgi:hypothetical protein
MKWCVLVMGPTRSTNNKNRTRVFVLTSACSLSWFTPDFTSLWSLIKLAQARPWRGARGAAAPGPQIPGAPSSICTCVEYVLRQKRNVGRLGKVKRQRFIGRGVGDSSISKSSYQFLINLLFPFRRREKATRRWQPERLTARRQVEPSVLSACASVLSPWALREVSSCVHLITPYIFDLDLHAYLIDLWSWIIF